MMVRVRARRISGFFSTSMMSIRRVGLGAGGILIGATVFLLVETIGVASDPVKRTNPP